MTALIVSIAVQATRSLVPFIIVLGVVSNVLNVLVLTRASLNRHPCSLYFSSMAVVNLFYCTFVLINNLLADGYQLDLSVNSVFFCKLIGYLLNLCPNMSIYLIVLAAFDRLSASSVHVRIRRFSEVRVARWAAGIVLGILAVLMAGAFVAFDLSDNGIRICSVPADFIFGQLFLIFDIVLFVIVAPTLLLLFGLLTIRNASQVRLNANRLTRYHRTERQLSRMLLLQVGIHMILILPFSLMLLMMMIVQVPFRFTVEFYYVYVISKLPFYLSFVIGFFSYILSAQIYRQELIRLLRKIHPRRQVTPFHTDARPNLNPSQRANTISMRQ